MAEYANNLALWRLLCFPRGVCGDKVSVRQVTLPILVVVVFEAAIVAASNVKHQCVVYYRDVAATEGTLCGIWTIASNIINKSLNRRHLFFASFLSVGRP